MVRHIKAICFDVGGTLRAELNPTPHSAAHLISLQNLLGDKTDPQVFHAVLRKREKAYRRWCRRTLIELSEQDLWERYMLPDLPAEFVRANALQFNHIWRSARKSTILPDAVETIKILKSRGYRLAIISNTTSSSETPQMLSENNLSTDFEIVLLSCQRGRRKPHPSLFVEAARTMDLPPCQCAYVGDNLSRDLVGALQAGYGEVVIINPAGYQEEDSDPEDRGALEGITEIKPDYRITRLSQLLEIYPGVQSAHFAPASPQPEHLYEVALSTMWGADQKMPFNESFFEARKMGFTCFELTNKVTPQLYQQWDRERFYVSTVHDPCPSELNYAQLKEKDLAISSLDENCRKTSLDMLKRSIDLAQHLGARSVVIHCGTVLCDHSRDTRLREMYRQGLQGSPAYNQLKEEFAADRAKHAAPHLEQVINSLQQISAFAKGAHVALALENRNRYFDIPLPDELALLLELCREDWFGFQYDVGHAHNQHVLGTVCYSEWLPRFKQRMIGVHLHDVRGITDHLAPAMGEIDFTRVAAHLPQSALRTLEIKPETTISQISAALEILSQSGCIQKLF